MRLYKPFPLNVEAAEFAFSLSFGREGKPLPAVSDVCAQIKELCDRIAVKESFVFESPLDAMSYVMSYMSFNIEPAHKGGKCALVVVGDASEIDSRILGEEGFSPDLDGWIILGEGQ